MAGRPRFSPGACRVVRCSLYAERHRWSVRATREVLGRVRAALAPSSHGLRSDAVSAMVQGMGGAVESFHFAFGDADVHVMSDLPDDGSAAARRVPRWRSRRATSSTVVLLTVAHADAALGVSVDYVPPGG